MGSELWTNVGSEPTEEAMLPHFIILGVIGICFVLCSLGRGFNEEYEASINSPGFKMDDHGNGAGRFSLSHNTQRYRMPRNMQLKQAKRRCPLTKRHSSKF